MILEAKPKRVRFRIKSGDEEHNSLESLKLQFVWNDIKQLFDGRLKKWLKRIDENSIADEIESLGQPEDTVCDILEVYNLLFRGKESMQLNCDPFSSIEDVLDEVSKTERDTKASALNLAHQILPKLAVDDLVELAYKYDNLEAILFPYIEKQVNSINGEESAETLYRLGRWLCEKSMSDETGQNLIKLASDKNLPDANDFIEHNFPWLGKFRAKWLSDLYKNDDIWKSLYNSWGGKSEDYHKTSEIKISDTNKEVNNLYNFSNTCLNIYKSYCCSISTCIPPNYYKILEKEFGDINEKDPLYEEKMFVLALFDSDDDNRWKNRLEKISHYVPAQEILNSRYYDIDGFRFSQPVYTDKNAKLLKYFILNLPKFRGEEVRYFDIIENGVSDKIDILASEINKILEDKTIGERLNNYWRYKIELGKGKSEAENLVIDFFNACVQIAKAKDPYKVALNKFGPISKNMVVGDTVDYPGKENGRLDDDPFYQEKKFILALFDKDFYRAHRNLNDIKNSFQVAKMLLNNCEKKVMIGSYVYQLNSFSPKFDNIKGLQFIATDLLKFRKYGK